LSDVASESEKLVLAARFTPYASMPTCGKPLTAFPVYVLKLLPAAADHRAVEFPLGFSVKALPIGALCPSGKRTVRTLKNAIDVKVLVT